MIVNEDILKWCEEYTGEPFHSVFCDPPYELGFMGKSWDSTGIAFDKNTWAAISRHLYPGAYLLAFGGTRTFHRIAVAIEDAGFEIRDTVMWVYGSGFPKSHNVANGIDKGQGLPNRGRAIPAASTHFPSGKYAEDGEKLTGNKVEAYEARTEAGKPWSGYGTALKPSWEPIIIARKPLEGTVAQNALKYGSGALNIDGSRVGTEEVSTHSNGKGNTGDGGIYGHYEKVVPGNERNGRWPANLIHDGSDEVVGMFPTSKTGNKRTRHKPSPTSHFGSGSNESVTGNIEGYSDEGSAARFFYSAKVSKRERDAGLEGFEETADTAKGNGLARICETCGASQLKPELCQCETKSWVLPKQKNHHPTLKPISLTTYLAKLILPPKLDKPRRLLVPFAGSGSEVIGGYLAGWDEVVGVEREKEYAEIAEARIKHWTNYSPQSSSSSTSVPPESTDSQEILDI